MLCCMYHDRLEQKGDSFKEQSNLGAASGVQFGASETSPLKSLDSFNIIYSESSFKVNQGWEA